MFKTSHDCLLNLCQFVCVCWCMSSAGSGAVMGVSESRGWWETAAYRSFPTALTLVPSGWKHSSEVGGHGGSPGVSMRIILIRNDLALYESAVCHLSALSRLTVEDLSRRWGDVWCEQTLSSWIEHHYGWNIAIHHQAFHKSLHNHLVAVIYTSSLNTMLTLSEFLDIIKF